MFLDNNAPLLVTPAEVESQFLTTEAKPKLAVLRAELKKRTDASPPPPLTAHVVSGNGQEMRVYIRGNPATDAMASPSNPLTARVIVNRVWALHFGRGLVNTPSNFGTLG